MLCVYTEDYHIQSTLIGYILCSTVNVMYCNLQPGIKSLVSPLSLGISTDESCGRVEFSVSSLLVNLINTPVLPVCCRS